MTEIVLVRHGETDWNREGRFRGRASVPLNESGLREAGATAQRIARDWRIAAVYSSPVARARRTAEVIVAATTPPLHLIDDLADVDYGAWEGLTASEAETRDSRTMQTFLTTPSCMRIPDGETFAEVQWRAVDAIRMLACRHRTDTIAVVAHTEVNRLIVLAALGGRIDSIWRLGQDTCAINVLRVENGVMSVMSVNDRHHLVAKR